MFEVGEEVVCIDNSGMSTRLNTDQIYLVDYADYPLIGLVGVAGTFHKNRFRTKVKPSPPIIENDMIYAFDVDETLIITQGDGDTPTDKSVEIVNPYSKQTLYRKPHARHIQLMREMHGRGRFIMVWSAGGVQWAKAVVEALKLQDVVGLIITKPIGYVDDKPAAEFMQHHIYLKDAEGK